jgi:hypothetical protein
MCFLQQHSKPAKLDAQLTQDLWSAACSDGWWLMAGASLFWEKSTVDLLLLAGLFWEKYCWLVADKPSEQGAETYSSRQYPSSNVSTQYSRKGLVFLDRWFRIT